MSEKFSESEHQERLEEILLSMGRIPTGNYAIDYAIITVLWEEDTEDEFKERIVELLRSTWLSSH